MKMKTMMKTMMKNSHIYRISIILAVIIFHSYGYAGNSISVRGAWIMAAPPNARVIAGYMTIENRSSDSRILVNVKSSHFKRIEIHRTINQGDMMKMVPRRTLEIPARGKVLLQPGSYHLMLIGPETVPREGEDVKLSLLFDNGLTLDIQVPVLSAINSSMMRSPH